MKKVKSIAPNCDWVEDADGNARLRVTDPDVHPESCFNALLLMGEFCTVGPGGIMDAIIPPGLALAVAEWPPDKRIAAYEWAMSKHFAASDNDGIIVPKMPEFLQEFAQ